MRNNFEAGKILADLAESKGWTIEDLSKVLGISLPNTYKKLKMTDLDTKFLRIAADAAGVEMSRLFAININQKGKFNTLGDASINYKPTWKVTDDEKILAEQVKGLERENSALKEQIKTLNKLVSMYENGK